MELKSKYTRFRAYKLGAPGSLFSYYDGTSFTLIEAFLTDTCIPQLNEELKECNFHEKGYIDCLHITSWDKDHCDKNSLEAILESLKPRRIEYPGYDISDIQNQKDCVKAINSYLTKMKTENQNVIYKSINPSYVNSLTTYTKWTYKNILFSNPKNYPKANDNSSIKLFRTGSFTVLSLGDIDDEKVKKHIWNDWVIKNEVDILLLAHHGSDNDVNTKDFFEKVKPAVAVCSSDYDNKYEHPRANVRQKLQNLNIPLKTTKNGDVIITSTGDNTANFSVQDLQSDNTAQKGYKTTYKSKRGKEKTRLEKKSNDDELIKLIRKYLAEQKK